ncbi:response regulator transcription factor [Gemmobacter denitrificans]|uniref:Response regulator transcription factor n=1 Tax=Gemmobacter denitrificans TaxID=3123040 RepID=A0ABU8BTE8_9RHOB
MKILIVDDDPRLREVLTIAFDRAGFATITAADGRSALIHAQREAPDLVVLDIGLPEMDGLEVCRRLRALSQIPILFLSARDEEIDRILGLELGADDYVTKPFSPREVVARTRAILKRAQGSASSLLVRGRLQLDPGRHDCRFGEIVIALTATEMTLLARLMQSGGQVVTRGQLVTAIWGAGSPVADRTLDSHIRNLRRKLTEAGAADAVETLHGVGLRIGPCT